MAMNALRRAFDLEKLAELRDSIIAITNKGIREWLSKREPSQIKALEKDLEKPLNLEEEIIKFKLMVKRDAKVKLDSSALQKHPPAQNIMFHRKAVNAIFSPCFDEFKNRVLTCVKPHIKFFTEMTNQQFARVAEDILGLESEYNVGEIDFSKYDKSQDSFIKACERKLYEAFGFEPELLSIWMEGEYRSEATTLDGQLSFTVADQRKSGASNTYIGNSVVTLCIICMYYQVQEFSALFISGDDSLIFCEKPIANYADEICLELGFDTKFLNPSVSYFCSKYLVRCEHKTYFLPDPYKLLVKLGKAEEKYKPADMFEIFTSFKDLTKDFGDERAVELCALLVQAKHLKESSNIYPALCTIHCLRANYSSFIKLYPKVTGWEVFYGKFSALLRRFGHWIRFEKYETPFGEAFFLSENDEE